MDLKLLQDKASIKVLKCLYNFGDIIKQSADKYEPYIIARYLIDLSQAFSSFYNENKIIGEKQEIQDARLLLTYAVGIVLKSGAKLLGIKMPNKM